jgi:stearoyl-CoA desaturase (Delta-9 desaturase)
VTKAATTAWLALLTLGEGWHNNHHYYPMSARQGFYWWEIDITYYLLRTLAALGIIWDLKPVPREVRDTHTAVAR